MRKRLFAFIAIGLVTSALAAGEPSAPQAGTAAAAPAGKAAEDGLIPSPEPGWPQWHGRWRDGVSRETGLMPTWPEGGPKALWTAENLGHGWSGPIITGGSMYLAGDFGPDCIVICLDSQGQERWRTPNGKAWTRNHKGARASCAYADGRVYHMNGHGRLTCLEAETGKELWAQNVLEQFGGKPITWGLSECVLVHDGKVFATPGGQQAFMVALDAKTGRPAWLSPPLPDASVQRTGYASPILLRFGGRNLVVNLALRALVCLDADTGRIYDTFAKRTKYDASCATPVYHRGGIFYTLPTKSGAVFLDLVAGDGGVRFRKKWEGRMDNCNGGAVAVDGYIYGSGWDQTGWVCYDVATGDQAYESTELARGAPTYADGRLYCLGEDGTMALVRPGPEAFDIVSRFRLVEEKVKDAWTHPVILDGRLYLRYHDRMTCYDIIQPK